MKIGIDFDRVLFDTDKFKQYLKENLPDFKETYSDAKEDGIYKWDKHAELMNISKKEYLEHIKKCSSFTYNDIESLKKLKDDHTLFIVSRGDPYFQGMKIRNSNVLKYVDDLFIVEDRPKDSVGIELLIDDWKEELNRVNIPTIHFNREKDNLDSIIEKVEEKNG